MSLIYPKEIHAIKINFAEQNILLSAKANLYFPDEQTLVVSDLHLEKGSYYASQGIPLPLCDTKETLLQLYYLIQWYEPKRVICLGDNFHDINALQRMNEIDLMYLMNLQKKVNEWIWIIGNHDADASLLREMNFGQIYDYYQMKKIFFRHDFNKDFQYQIIGHYHPKLSLTIRSNTVTGKCFIHDDNTLIMPSFGTFTGGLDIKDKAYDMLNKLSVQSYLLYQDKVWQI